jgi:anti-sigma B factor antagonist
MEAQVDWGCSVVLVGRVKQSPEEENLDVPFAAIRSNTDCEAHRMFSEGFPRSAPSFRLSVSESADRAIVSLEGELDLATAPQLRDQLVTLAEQDGSDVVVDLTRLAFIDSTGLSVLVMALNRSRAAGGSIVLRNPSESVMRILEITGLVSVFGIDEKSVPTAGA